MDRRIYVDLGPASPFEGSWMTPGSDCLRVEPQCQLPTFHQSSVVLRPVANLISEGVVAFAHPLAYQEGERWGWSQISATTPIIVPSVAVREGVLKTLQVTEAHFKALYDNPPYRYYVYDSANLSQVRQFALSDGLEIMVMTIDAFARAENVIRQSTDRLQGERPLSLIQASRPVLILDEPQNMESENRIAALVSLHPLFALRYSATHRNPYSLIYRLTPYDAYRQGLVKRIEVASVIEEDNQNQPFLRLDEIKIQSKKPSARLSVHKLMRSGVIKENRADHQGRRRPREENRAR